MARQQSKKSNNGNAKAKKPKLTSGQTSSRPATGSTGRSKTNSGTMSTNGKTKATTSKSSASTAKTARVSSKTTGQAARTPAAKGKKAAITGRKTERTVGWTGETVPMTKSAADVTCGIKPTFEQIQQRAYEIYLARGATPGDPTSDWLRAERELREGRTAHKTH